MEVLGEPNLLLIYFVYTPAGDFHLCFAPRVCRLRVQGISLLHHVILKHQTPWFLFFSPASWCLFCPILSVQSCWSCHQGDLLQEQRCAHAGQVCLLSLGGEPWVGDSWGCHHPLPIITGGKLEIHAPAYLCMHTPDIWMGPS